MNIHIHHRTSYHFASSVSLGPHYLMMRPRQSHGIQMEGCAFKISAAHNLRWIRDLHENDLGIIDFMSSESEFVIQSDCTLKIAEENPFNFVIASDALEYPFSYAQELFGELRPLIRTNYARDVDRLREWINPFWHAGKRVDTLSLLQQLNSHIYRTFRYQRRMERGVQSPAETLEKNSGSCRDFATLFMEACRSLGLAARFVSGYMYSPEITGQMSMHGWAEIYLPGAGWIGFDPSWGILADSHYFAVAVTRHSEHAPPISGTYIGTPRTFLRTQVDLFVKRTDLKLVQSTELKSRESTLSEPVRVG